MSCGRFSKEKRVERSRWGEEEIYGFVGKDEGSVEGAKVGWHADDIRSLTPFALDCWFARIM